MFHRRAMPNPARLDREDERRMLPCRFFLAGYCQRGQRCKFFHPNMHVREPWVRVPDLPASFTAIPQHGRPRVNGAPSLFDMIPRSRSRGGDRPNLRTPVSGNSATSISPKSRSKSKSKDTASKSLLMSPTSLAYSEYQAQGNTTTRKIVPSFDEDEDSDGRDSKSPERRAFQNTIFNHIDWSEFLVPGVAPPLPTPVPDQGAALSPIRRVDVDEGFYNRPPNFRGESNVRRPLAKIAIEDVPPEGSIVSGRMDQVIMETSDGKGGKKLSAKEELQLKVKQLASELPAPEEPVSHVRSLDSFFRSFKFNGYNVTATSQTAAVVAAATASAAAAQARAASAETNDEDSNKENANLPSDLDSKETIVENGEEDNAGDNDTNTAAGDSNSNHTQQ